MKVKIKARYWNDEIKPIKNILLNYGELTDSPINIYSHSVGKDKLEKYEIKIKLEQTEDDDSVEFAEIIEALMIVQELSKSKVHIGYEMIEEDSDDYTDEGKWLHGVPPEMMNDGVE